MIDNEHEAEPTFTEPIEGVFTCLGKAVIEPPKWVVKNLIPTGLTFIGAPPKSGKSTLEMALAAVVSGLPCGALPLDLMEPGVVGPVMGFSAEASAGELRHMMEEGLHLTVPDDESILIADDPFAWRLDDPNGQARLSRWLDERKPKLLFIDPLRDFHQFDEKESGEMNRLLRPYQQWAKATDSAFVVVHHTTKPREGQVEYDPLSLRGSSALFGMADAVLMLTPLQNDFVKLKATFKRAVGWERSFRMAVYGYAGQPALELITEIDKQILKGVKAGWKNEDIFRHLRVGKDRLIDSMLRLERCGYITRGDSGLWILKQEFENSVGS